MSRGGNTDGYGAAFAASVIAAAWAKGVAVPGQDANVLWKDRCGAWIKRSEYGNTSSELGWEVDHLRPDAMGGGDELADLEPLQWQNNRGKSDGYPSWSCAVSAKLGVG